MAPTDHPSPMVSTTTDVRHALPKENAAIVNWSHGVRSAECFPFSQSLYTSTLTSPLTLHLIQVLTYFLMISNGTRRQTTPFWCVSIHTQRGGCTCRSNSGGAIERHPSGNRTTVSASLFSTTARGPPDTRLGLGVFEAASETMYRSIANSGDGSIHICVHR